MGRPAGLAKTGGRLRGTPNKQTDALMRKLRKLGCDPLEGLARIALDPQTDVALKVRCFSELAPYAYPKRKAVDVQSTSEFKVAVEHIGHPTIDLGGLPVPKF